MAQEVEMYATVQCNRCNYAKRLIEKAGLVVNKHVVNDMSGNVVGDYQKVIDELGIREVPVIVWPDGEVTHGFSDTEIRERLQACSD